MDIWFLIAIVLIAFFYSSVGHGGATGYLTLMALYGLAPEVMRPTALMLNLLVSSIAFLQYFSKGYFKLKLLLPFVITSIPLAFIGARLPVDPAVYKILLGIALVFSTFRMFFRDYNNLKPRPAAAVESGLWGAGIGFFSGIIGIGGGVFLSPLLLLKRWAGVKETAALSSAFIFLNSLSGSLAILPGFSNMDSRHFLWIGAAFAGAISGSWVGSRKFTPQLLAYILGAVLIIVGLKLVIFSGA